MKTTRQRGFTLIELMITVAILAIITSLAYPAYTQHLVRGKRSAAQSFMQTVGSKQEQSMLNARNYFQVVAQTDWATASMAVPADVSANYTITVAASSTPPAYTVTAVPTSAQPDAKCGTLTLTQAGAKTISGTSSVADCWR